MRLDNRRMPHMKKWLIEQWRQVRGHIKFEIGKWLIFNALGGATLIGLVVWFRQKLLHASPDWYLFGFVFAASLILFLYSDAKIVKNFFSRTSSPIPSSQDPAPEIPLEPHKARLKADILDILFHTERFALMNDVFVLLQVRVVNHGEEEVVINEWKLETWVGEDKFNLEQVDIPEIWRIKHTPPGGPYSVENPDRHLIEGPLRKGIPQTCWVNFKMQALGRVLPPHNAKFVLTLEDALGATHVAETLAPGFFAETGYIIIGQEGEGA